MDQREEEGRSRGLLFAPFRIVLCMPFAHHLESPRPAPQLAVIDGGLSTIPRRVEGLDRALAESSRALEQILQERRWPERRAAVAGVWRNLKRHGWRNRWPIAAAVLALTLLAGLGHYLIVQQPEAAAPTPQQPNPERAAAPARASAEPGLAPVVAPEMAPSAPSGTTSGDPAPALRLDRSLTLPSPQRKSQ